MARWQFNPSDTTTTYDYPSLGFRAANGQVCDNPVAPDARWSSVAGTTPVTVTLYGPATGTVPTPPADGSVLTYNASTGVPSFQSPTGNATFVQSKNATPGTIIPLGTSITAGANAYGGGWALMLRPILGGRAKITRNAGVAGNTSTQILARLAADVIAYAPQICIVQCLTNDAANLSPATTVTNVTAIITQLRAAGIIPVLCTDPPIVAHPTEIQGLNARMRSLALTYNCPLIDFYSVTVASTGGWKTGYDSGDGIHPTALGHMAMAQEAARIIGPLVPASRQTYLTFDNTDQLTMLVNAGLNLTDGGGGVPANWGATTALTTTLTRSLVTTTGVAGQMARMAISAGTAGSIVNYRGWPGGYYAAGDTVHLAAMVNVESASGLVPANGDGISLRCTTTGGGAATTVLAGPVSVATPGPVLLEGRLVLPAGITGGQIELFVQVPSTGAITCSWGQATAYDLTGLGLT